MAQSFLSLGLFQLVLPLTFTVCVAVRQNCISLVYLLFLLCLPAIPDPSPTSRGLTSVYIKAVIFFSLIASLAQVAFHSLMHFLPRYLKLVENYDHVQELLQHIGFVHLHSVKSRTAAQMIAPDPLVLVVSVLVYVTSYRMDIFVEDRHSRSTSTVHLSSLVIGPRGYLPEALGKYFVLSSMCVAGVMRPSLSSAVYFLCFLGGSTWWGCYKQLRKPFSWVCRICLLFVGVHIIAFFLHQMTWFQESIPVDNIYARIFGLTTLVKMNSTDQQIYYETRDWDYFVNPFALLWLYFVLAYVSKQLFISPEESRNRAEVLRNNTSLWLLQHFGKPSLMGVAVTELDLGSFKQFIECIISIYNHVTQSSHIPTNIIMMAWSITYHSWLTFVWLIWVTILWIIPNKRRSTLLCSPFIVLYAEFLLISHYIYAMNLKDNELPVVVEGSNLSQIGFVKSKVYPCVSLLIKCLYTVVFWITLRQFMKQRKVKKKKAPVMEAVDGSIVVKTSPTEVPSIQELIKVRRTTLILEHSIYFVKKKLARVSVFLVTLVLCTIALGGHEVEVYRIVYVSLFLVFLLVFQLSYNAWRLIMYGFWLTVIIYSMMILIFIYTYQFDYFDVYWEKYFHVPRDIQGEIGLQVFDTEALFTHLLVPASFVVLTVLHLQHFHKPFLVLYDMKSMSSSRSAIELNRKPYEAEHRKVVFEEMKEESNEEQEEEKEIAFHVKSLLAAFKELCWCCLELHIMKLIALSAILLAVYDVCAVHFIFVLLVVLAQMFGNRFQFISCFICSLYASVLLLAKQIYQIRYISNLSEEANCTNKTEFGNTSASNAEWLGFRKSSDIQFLLKGYIGFIAIMTVQAIVTVRQKHCRLAKGLPLTPPPVLFPKIHRKDADKNILNCIKFIINYGFYKFGVEISFMTTVAVIANRLDIYSVFYALWLCILHNRSRKSLSKMWIFYVMFIAIVILMQYVICVGFPPLWCIEFSWYKEEILKRIRVWIYLPDYSNPPMSHKLIGDFILYMITCRQLVVFSIEKNESHPGGRNVSASMDADDWSNNPTPDYLSEIRSWLDVLKKIIFTSFFYVTLGVIYLAGTRNVNIYAIGYLVGSFTFLWLGNDFYLRHIKSILQWWNYLFTYNVSVIFCKVLLKVSGCIFIRRLQVSACWAIQFLGIACELAYNSDDMNYCNVPVQTMIAWDGVCFGFIILQRKFFQSYYFFHLITEAKAQTVLASRGADLVQELNDMKVKNKREMEKNTLEKIKAKMTRIKATHKKLHRRKEDLQNHYVAMRMGDYYMFEHYDDEDVTDDYNNQEEDFTYETEMLKMRSTLLAEDILKKRTEAKTRKEHIGWFLKYAKHCINACLTFLSRWINKFSRDYQYVSKCLANEKKMLKKQDCFKEGLRQGHFQVWEPKVTTLLQTSVDLVEAQEIPNTRNEDVEIKFIKSKSSSLGNAYEDEKDFTARQWPITFLITSIWYLVLSHSELLCYAVIILSQVSTGDIVGTPLVLMVFLWGTLSVPQPSKTFWVTLIAYTQVCVIMKCIFQFNAFFWTSQSSAFRAQYYPPRVIGIDKSGHFADYELAILMFLYFHRFMLKTLGLWKTSPWVISEVEEIQINKDLDLNALRRESNYVVQSRNVSQQVCILSETVPTDNSMQEKISHTFLYFPDVTKLAIKKYMSMLKKFFDDVLHTESKLTTDVYAYMFICDFVNFVIILVGFPSFSVLQAEGVTAVIEEDKVPVPFLIMLIIHFSLIVIDRALYLKKWLLGKLIYQIILTLCLHLWIFFILPIVTGRDSTKNFIPQVWYVIKCIYLLISAYQIRSGYSSRILGNFIWKQYGYVSFILFKGYMLVPLLYECRNIMDWMWTPSSMTIMEWFLLEDITSHLYIVKCIRQGETDWPQPRGVQKNPLVKYAVGIGGFAAIFLLLWFPLIIFSLGGTVGQPNVPYEVEIALRLGNYEPIFHATIENPLLQRFSVNEYHSFLTAYKKDSSAQNFLNRFNFQDVVIAQVYCNSSVWGISPASQWKVISDITNDRAIEAIFSWKISTMSYKLKIPPVAKDSQSVVLNDKFTMQTLLAMLRGKQFASITIDQIFPKFLYVTNKRKSTVVNLLTGEGSPYRNLIVTLRHANFTTLSATHEWWEVREQCNDSFYESVLRRIPYNRDCATDPYFNMYIFTDKNFPSEINFLSSSGVFGIYVTIVFVVSRYIRLLFYKLCFVAQYEEVPGIDRIYQLCMDIYTVRERGEYQLEEDLYARLLFLYRSPETMVTWTRLKSQESLEDEQSIEPAQ